VQLVHTPQTYVVADGLFVPPGAPDSGIAVSAELETTSAQGDSAVVTFTLLDTDGTTVLGAAQSAAVQVPPSGGATAIARATLRPLKAGSVRLWTTRAPTMCGFAFARACTRAVRACVRACVRVFLC
jgi:hypothetical protein